jgi:hypothetical protein
MGIAAQALWLSRLEPGCRLWKRGVLFAGTAGVRELFAAIALIVGAGTGGIDGEED